MSEVEKAYTDFVLPPCLVTRLDVSHLVSEVERIDDEMTSADVRAKTGAPAQPAPAQSAQLTDFLSQNGLTLGSSTERSALIRQLHLLKDNVPTIHMTFAVEADRESLERLSEWVRGSVHPQAVIAVGLQPALIAGVYLRTPNHVHDLSMRAKLKGGHGMLVEELEALHAGS